MDPRLRKRLERREESPLRKWEKKHGRLLMVLFFLLMAAIVFLGLFLDPLVRYQ